MRLLILPKRNYITALIRPSFTSRGTNYTEFGTTMRCMRNDQTAETMVIHYVNDGTCTARIRISKQELVTRPPLSSVINLGFRFLTPVVLFFYALTSTTDYEIFKSICAPGDVFSSDRMERVCSFFSLFFLVYLHPDAARRQGAEPADTE
jgi:DNA-directed RNA polymerase I subunit RPA2